MNHLRLLRYVDEVARVGSIRQAAERLHVAPSAVNRRIQDIEDELGTPIFERLPRGMRLTAAGELFVRYIRNRSADLERVRSEIEDLQGMRRGVVRLVASQALAPKFLPAAIQAFRATHPLVAFEVRIGDHVQAANALRGMETDLALVFNLGTDADIERMDAVEQKLMAVMHVRHPLAHRAGLRLRDCAEHPVVLSDRDTGGRQLLERFLARSSIRMQAMVESNSFEFLRGCISDGHSISFQMAVGAALDDPQIVAREIEDRGFPRGELVLASLRGRQLPVIAYAFAEFLRKRLAELGSAPAVNAFRRSGATSSA